MGKDQDCWGDRGDKNLFAWGGRKGRDGADTNRYKINKTAIE
jgi:hypothetical protein